MSNEPTAAAPLEAQPITATPAPGQRINHNGKEFTTIKEGLAYILVPASGPTVPQQKPTGETAPQTVFYNPIQQFNRDLSVLAIKAYSEEAIKKKEAIEAKKKKAAANLKKRKREKKETQGGGVSKAQKVGEDGAKADLEQPMLTGGREGPADEIFENSIPKTAEETPVVEVRAENKDEDKPADGQEGAESNGGPKSFSPPPFTILDALSATGLRALRYSHEIPAVTSVTANDLLPDAVKSINLNVEHNKLGHKINARVGNAMAHMYEVGAEALPTHDYKPTKKYDVIDLDPYGSAAPFLDGAVQSVRDDGGLLCVTCTDAGVWASNGYPEKCYSLYGGMPLKGVHSHEGGLRLILHAIASSAARYGMVIEPLLSLSIDFYARVFVKMHKSPADVKFLAGKTMLVNNCDSGCLSCEPQMLGKNTLRTNKNGQGTFWKHSFGGANGGGKCNICARTRHVGGPMWGGPLHDANFIQKILDALPTVDKDIYHTTTRIHGMLTLASEELMSPPPRDDDLIPPPPGKGRPDPSIIDPYPFYFASSALSKIIHCETPDEASIRGALLHAGYKVTRTHAKSGVFKTDAPWPFIWHVMREWARQVKPIKEGVIKPNTPGWSIMYMDKTEDEKAAIKAQFEKDFAGKTEVVFDTMLGKDPKNKGLVRYQLNPRENWGPMTRAKGPDQK